MKNRVRVVVTGMGAMTPLGETVESYWDGLITGRSGIGPMTLCDPTGFPCRVAGEVKGFDPAVYMGPKEARRMSRFSQLAVAAALRAREDADFGSSETGQDRMGVVLGNGIGGIPDIQSQCEVMFSRGGMRVSPFFIPMILPNMAAANISRLLGLKGYSATVITACAAGTQAIGDGAEVIRRGAADVVYAGGTEAGITTLALSGFCVMKALTERNEDPEHASRPFDAKRDGFVPAEGAAVLVLEELEHAVNRGAHIYGELSGFGVSSDAFHPVQPAEDGSGPARAMSWALSDANISSGDVDYINAHGTSTVLNDAAETAAIKRVFGPSAYKVPISSTKSMLGHAMGGSGAVEAVAALQTLRTSIIHPTINYEFSDPACDLDYVPNVARQSDVRTVLSNSFGFGGQNASLVFTKFQEE
jgi:3-oxoacyl-[acyl-carrier-protein] synthase II